MDESVHLLHLNLERLWCERDRTLFVSFLSLELR